MIIIKSLYDKSLSTYKKREKVRDWLYVEYRYTAFDLIILKLKEF